MIARFGEELRYLLEIELVGAVVSSIIVNTEYSFLNMCYDLKPLEWDKRTNSCIRVDIRELNRKLFTK